MMQVRLVPILTTLAVLPGAAVLPQAPPSPQVVERPFAAGGTVSLDLSAGAYVIRGTPDDAIKVRWKTKSAGDAGRVQNDVATQGTAATIRTRGPKDGFSVEIDLPARSDVHVSLSAGDLRIRSLEGSKSVSMWAGDVLIEVGAAEQYRKVDASVRVGDLSMEPFGLKKTGGLFRSQSWTGPGRYTISATLTAGDLKLVR